MVSFFFVKVAAVVEGHTIMTGASNRVSFHWQWNIPEIWIVPGVWNITLYRLFLGGRGGGRYGDGPYNCNGGDGGGGKQTFFFSGISIIATEVLQCTHRLFMMQAMEVALAVLVDITMAATVDTIKATTRAEVVVVVEAMEETDMTAMAMETVVVEEVVVAAEATTTTWATTTPRRPTSAQWRTTLEVVAAVAAAVVGTSVRLEMEVCSLILSFICAFKPCVVFPSGGYGGGSNSGYGRPGRF